MAGKGETTKPGTGWDQRHEREGYLFGEKPNAFLASRAREPGALLLCKGYRPEQIAHGMGGSSNPVNDCTEPMLRAAFPALEIPRLESRDAVIEEGAGHRGMSALIDLVARRPV